MAKQKPQIVGSVRIKGKVYRAGMEEELSRDAEAAGMKESDLKRLIDKGVITGVEAAKESAAKAEVDETGPKSGKASGTKAK